MVDVVVDVMGPIHVSQGPPYRVHHCSADDCIYQVDTTLH